MQRSTRSTRIRRFAAGLMPLAIVIGCDSPLDAPPDGQPIGQVPVAAIEIRAPSGALAVGQAVPLGVRVLAADGAALVRPINWTSSDSLVASVSPAGVVSARAGGTADVMARHGGVSAHVGITVRPADTVASVEIEAPFAGLAAGQVVGLTARVRAEDGALLHRAVTWSSSDPAIASITAQGVLTAHGAGQVRITASVDDRQGTTVFTVRTGEPAMVTQLLPASVPAGSAGFEMSIRGTGFQDGALVRMGGAERPARVISSAEIRIDVSAEDVRQAGGFEVRVYNPGQTLGSNQIYFIVEHIPSTRTYDLVGSAYETQPVLPVLTGGFHHGGDITRYVEEFVTAGVLRIHQPATGAETWELTLTMVSRTNQGELVKEEDLVFFGRVEWPAPGGQRALRLDMFPNVVLHTVQSHNGDLLVWQTLHPSGDPMHEKVWRYLPR
jgi:hypothetical protein